ncbi:SMP-30/gluconolactonase/LRE family protein [Kiloniella laminariae]|uniref:SMP-30/gluconolactonase/LRE family protein n=1 Tax=Kiloniella laminariae TaxID=454162 RepID=A0ABT4LNK2_9PROT|nr:SMP-30/gluconolactonase/LRE family protein [Kiloniella laminariae]MCZ4282725.1 SMP-30/gluconolactonase/LRE family protein [Kiloniella laminariae]
MQSCAVEKIWEGPALLGESPLWDFRDNCLYWLDIENARLYRKSADGKTTHSLALPAPAGSIALCDDGGLIAALGQGLSLIDMDSGIVSPLAPSLASTECLMNDGKADRYGNFFFGTKHLKETSPLGRCWRYTRGQILQQDGAFVVFNGPAFSPAGERIYFADSPSRRIMTARYDEEYGINSKPEVFAQLSESDGYPDGMTIDSEGCLWNAQWDGWAITRYQPDGTIERKLELPVQRPTSVCFGGKDLKTLYITSASTRLTPEEISHNPDAGALFKLDLDIAGIPETSVNYKD